MLIDEIQYAPTLLPHIKMAVDEDRTAGRFWLTGSQQFHLMQGISESLAGRVGVVNLLGLSQRELENDPTSDPFIPTEALLRARDRSRTILLPELFERIWLGSFLGLYQESAVDRDLFYSSWLVKSPKLYLLDTGLSAGLTEWSSAATLEAGAMSGAFWETWIVAEVLKSFWHNGKRAPIYYYRDKDKKEVDLLIHQDGILYPIEIKKTASPDKKSIRHFKTLHTLKLPIGPGCVLSLAPTRLPLSDSVQAVPMGML